MCYLFIFILIVNINIANPRHRYGGNLDMMEKTSSNYHPDHPGNAFWSLGGTLCIYSVLSTWCLRNTDTGFYVYNNQTHIWRTCCLLDVNAHRTAHCFANVCNLGDDGDSIVMVMGMMMVMMMMMMMMMISLLFISVFILFWDKHQKWTWGPGGVNESKASYEPGNMMGVCWIQIVQSNYNYIWTMVGLWKWPLSWSLGSKIWARDHLLPAPLQHYPGA